MKSVRFVCLLGFFTACTLARPQGETLITPDELKPPANTLIPMSTQTPGIIHTSTPVQTVTPEPTHTALPTSTHESIQGTPATPTRLPEPYLIYVKDWEMVRTLSPMLCSSCGVGTTTVQAPRGMSIAVVQVYIKGEEGSASRVTTDLVYTSPEELNCALKGGEEFCGLIFGQVIAGRITVSALYVGGGEHQLEYLVTFQDWADYHP
jgi:hypothetical protein